jgi:hypothetical protein
MTDLEAVLYSYFASVTALTSTLGTFEGGTCLYASNDLPEGYRAPEHGPAVLFKVRGGDQSFSSKQLAPSVQFQCFASTEAKARTVVYAVFEAVNDQRAAGIKWCRVETLPQIVIEPSVGWPYGLLYAQFWMDNP